MKLPMIYVLAVAVVSAQSVRGGDCECSAPRSVDDVLGRALSVFEGTVVEQQRTTVRLQFTSEMMTHHEITVRFAVDSAISGSLPDTVEVMFYEGRGECDIDVPEFTFGQRYLVSTTECVGAESGEHCNDYCCLRTLLPKSPPVAAAQQPVEMPETTTTDTADATAEEKPRRGWFRKLLFWK